MPATTARNYQPHATPVSFVTGLPQQPAEDAKCVRCKTADAAEFVSFEYVTGRKGKTAVGHKATCSPCNELFASEMNAKIEAKAAKGTKAKKNAKKGQEKTTSKPSGKPTLTADEQAIAEKYGIEVKPGSLHRDEDRKKNVLTMFCQICKKPREIATQDAFQVRTCGEPECKKAHKKANG